MEMSEGLKRDGECAAEVFLASMPEDTFARFNSQKLHHQLVYFFCWLRLMEEDL